MINKPILLAAIGLLTFSGTAMAAAVGDIDDRKAAQEAELIFSGTVSNVEYAFSSDADAEAPRLPHTFVTYQVEKTYKGATKDESITLRFIGGRGEEAEFLLVSGLPLFDVGDRDILFVRGNGTSSCPLVDCAGGRYRLLQGKVFSEDGQAVELNAKGDLELSRYYDLPEVMTHKVSMTTLTRRDQLDAGEERETFKSPGSGAHIDSAMLTSRIADSIKTRGVDNAALVTSADRAAPFAIAAMRAVAPPASVGKENVAMEPAPVSSRERAEVEALKANGGNPVIDAR